MGTLWRLVRELASGAQDRAMAGVKLDYPAVGVPLRIREVRKTLHKTLEWRRHGKRGGGLVGFAPRQPNQSIVH
jgi:hypothetical protein